MMYEPIHQEFDMPTHADFVTGLPFGNGRIGEYQKFKTREEQISFAQGLQAYTLQLTMRNTADCVDERRTIALGDGTTDPRLLAARVVPQLPGGLVLPVTKAAVAANLAVIRDVKDFTGAYLVMYDLLEQLGFIDGGHQKCGASALVEQSVAHELSDDVLLATLPVLTTVDTQTSMLIGLNQQTKRHLLESGYFGNWRSLWHEAFLGDKVPQNFSILAEDPNDPVTHGHHAAGVYVIKSADRGFAKNQFIDMTGREAFATTVSAAATLTNRIISRIGGSQEERARLRLEFAIDTPQVLNELVVKGIPVFAEIA
jgi:hypothetical protein